MISCTYCIHKVLEMLERTQCPAHGYNVVSLGVSPVQSAIKRTTANWLLTENHQ